MSEEWRPIPTYEGLYDASSHGRIRSHDRLIRMNNRWGGTHVETRVGRLLRQQFNVKTHYFHVTLYKDGLPNTHTVHRLVLLTFHGRPQPGQVACHTDGNSGNNHLANLRWDSAAGNVRDTIRNGRYPGAKLTLEQIKLVQTLPGPARELASQFNVGMTTIYRARHYPAR